MKSNRLVTSKKVEVYATALTSNVAEEGGEQALAQVRNQLRFIISYMRSKPEFVAAVDTDEFSPEQRRELIHNVLVDFDPILVDVVGVMAERGDMSLLPRVYHTFDQQICDEFNIVSVDVTTVVPLDDHLRDVVKDKIKKDLGKKAIINERINEDILGGIIMSVQGKRIDASLRSQLNIARETLKKTN